MKIVVLFYMARKRRSCPPETVLHLCNRAAGQITIFQNPYDYMQVLQVLGEALEKFPISLYAFCIMPNHWHLLLQASKPKAVSRFMHWFGTTHTTRYRKSHETVGRGALYQNRFRSHPVHGAAAFIKTAAYIEQNALTAGLVSKVSAWRWGSAFQKPALPLTPWPIPKPTDWKQLTREPLDGETLQRLRFATRSSTRFIIEPTHSYPPHQNLRGAA